MVVHIQEALVGHMLNLAYILWAESGEGLVIDPSFGAEDLWRISQVREIHLRYIINTHGHFDHVQGNPWLARKSGAKVAIHEADSSRLDVPPDVILHGGEILQLGDLGVEVIHTPGHTPGGICLHVEGNLFTGDTLFVGGYGRTDLDGGSDANLFKSLRRLGELDGNVKIFPGHHYGEDKRSTISREKRINPGMLCGNLEEFRLLS